MRTQRCLKYSTERFQTYALISYVNPKQNNVLCTFYFTLRSISSVSPEKLVRPDSRMLLVELKGILLLSEHNWHSDEIVAQEAKISLNVLRF